MPAQTLLHPRLQHKTSMPLTPELTRQLEVPLCLLQQQRRRKQGQPHWRLGATQGQQCKLPLASQQW